MESADQPSGAPPAALDGLAGAVAVTADAVADLAALPEELAYADSDDLLDATVALDTEITRLHALRARLLRRIDRQEAYRARGCVTTASWWRDATHRDHATATRQVRTARRLGELGTLSAAFDDAAVTVEHCDAVANACKPGRTAAIVDADDILTRLARQARPRDVRVACRRIADLVDADGAPAADDAADPAPEEAGDDADEAAQAGDAGEDGSCPDPRCTAAACVPGTCRGASAQGPGGRDPERGLWLHRSFDGRWRLTADLETVTGERLFTLLEHADTPDDPDTDPSRRRSPAQRRHDAFSQLLKAVEELPDLPTRHGARPRLLVIIDLLTLLGHDACASRRPRLASGGQIAVDAALELLAAASLTPVLNMGPFRSVAVGRTHRTLPDWLRPLLAATHRHCRGPSCDRPIPWTQAAHLDGWIAGGETDLDRTIPACTAHHQMMDVDGWRVDFDPDTARITWTRPDDGYETTTEPPEP